MLRDISNAAASICTEGATTKTFTRRRKGVKSSSADDNTEDTPVSPVSLAGSTTQLSKQSSSDSPCCSTGRSDVLLACSSTCLSAAATCKGRRSSLLHAAAVPGHQLCREAPASRSLLLHKISKARQRALQLYTEQMAKYYAEVDEFELVEESPDAAQTKAMRRTNQQKQADVLLQTPALPFAHMPAPVSKHSIDAACQQASCRGGLSMSSLASQSPEPLTDWRQGCDNVTALAEPGGQQQLTELSAAARAGGCADTGRHIHPFQQQEQQQDHQVQVAKVKGLAACRPAVPLASSGSDAPAAIRLQMLLPDTPAVQLPDSSAAAPSRTAGVMEKATSRTSNLAADTPLQMLLPETPVFELTVNLATRLVSGGSDKQNSSQKSALTADTPLQSQVPDTPAFELAVGSPAQHTSSSLVLEVQDSTSTSTDSSATGTPLQMHLSDTPAIELAIGSASQPNIARCDYHAGQATNIRSSRSLAAETPLQMQLSDTSNVHLPDSPGVPGLLASVTPVPGHKTATAAAAPAAGLAAAEQIARQLERVSVSARDNSRHQPKYGSSPAQQQQQAACSTGNVEQLQQQLQQLDLAAAPTKQPVEHQAGARGMLKHVTQQEEPAAKQPSQRKQSARQQAARHRQQQKEADTEVQQQQKQDLYQLHQQQHDMQTAVQHQEQALQQLLLQQHVQLRQQMEEQLMQLDERQLQQLMQQMEQQMSLDAAQQLADVEAAAAAQAAFSPLQRMLQACGQSMLLEEVPSIADFVASVSASKEVIKLGEGTYGEAFKSGDVVFKFVPMEGDNLINGWPQKGAADLLGEAVIARTLSELSEQADAAGNLYPSHTEAFVKTHRVGVCRGPYPKSFIKAWHAWDKKHNAENDPIDTLPDTQLYAVFAMANCGKDLEGYTLLGFDQARSMMLQVAAALAVAEDCLAFEHRDLHWGNIMLTATPQHDSITVRLRGKTVQVATHGAAVRLIDFTASRLQTPAGDVAFCDLELEDGMFDGPKGKPQFETYRRMRKLTKKDWAGSYPGTNVLWLLYITELLLGNEKPIPRATAGQKRQLREFKKRLAGYSCCGEVMWDELFSGLLVVLG